jgi:hypothetical protein
MPIHNFPIVREADGKLRVPMWTDGHELWLMMDEVWKLFLVFVENYLMLTLNFRLNQCLFWLASNH